MANHTTTPSDNGEVIAGRYQLLQMIGHGGHGFVWRARDRQSGNDVAVKMLTDVAARDPGQVERLKREQQAMVALAGTSAVGFVDLCQSASGKLCLVMELLDGSDFEQRLEALEARGEQLGIAELVSVLDPVVETLERAHQSGILHRDLKPANLFLTSDGVRLLDFGLARLRSALPLTAAGTIVGSPSYIAPEAWKGRPDGLDQRVDVYSLGVLVFRALSGRLPFEGKTLQEKFQLATAGRRPSLHVLRPDLPADIDQWVEQVLAIDPDLRFNSMRGAWNAFKVSADVSDMGADLVSAADLESVQSASSPFVTPEPRPAPSSSSGVDTASSAAARGIRRGLGDVFKRAASAVRRLAGSPRPWEELEPSPVSAPPPVAEAPQRERSFVHEWLAGSEYHIQPEPKPAVVISPVLAVGAPKTAEPSAPAPKAEREPSVAKKRPRAKAKPKAEPEAGAAAPATARKRRAKAPKKAATPRAKPKPKAKPKAKKAKASAKPKAPRRKKAS